MMCYDDLKWWSVNSSQVSGKCLNIKMDDIVSLHLHTVTKLNHNLLETSAAILCR